MSALPAALLSPVSQARLVAPPRYLRAVVTAKCPLACSYCHMEGDPASGAVGPSAQELAALISAGVDNGIQKVKLLGGEPLVRSDLPDIVALLRERHPELDLSVITSGAVPVRRLDALFDAGLTRANLSIHGWRPEAFAARRGSSRQHDLRAETLARLLELGRPLKLNYVYGDASDRDDLAALLDWAAGRRLVVNLLDDLNRPELGPHAVIDVLCQLRGQPDRVHVEPDPMSLDTLHLTFADGLVVEVKHQQLGHLSAWRACATCSVRSRCREGIHALRLTHEGILRPCMDRPDLGIPLLALLRAQGGAAVSDAWGRYLEEATR